MSIPAVLDRAQNDMGSAQRISSPLIAAFSVNKKAKGACPIASTCDDVPPPSTPALEPTAPQSPPPQQTPEKKLRRHNPYSRILAEVVFGKSPSCSFSSNTSMDRSSGTTADAPRSDVAAAPCQYHRAQVQTPQPAPQQDQMQQQELQTPRVLPASTAAAIALCFKKNKRQVDLFPGLKPCKYDQVQLDGLGGLDSLPGFVQVMPANTFAGSRHNKTGSRLPNGYLVRPPWVDGNHPLVASAAELRCGSVSAHYSAPMIRDLVHRLTGVMPISVHDKPPRNPLHNGMWRLGFKSQSDADHVFRFTGCAVTGDECTWMFDGNSRREVKRWIDERRLAVTAMPPVLRDDGSVKNPGFGTSPVSFER